MEGTFSVVLLAPLLQLILALVLLRGLRLGRPLPSSPWAKALCSLGVGILPAIWQMLSSLVFQADWQGARGGHWTSSLLDGDAGLVLVPFVLLAGVFFAQALHSQDLRRCWATPLLPISLWTAAAICLWYVVAVWVFEYLEPEFPRGDWVGQLMVSAFPGLSGVNFALAALHVRRIQGRASAPRLFQRAWWGSFAGAMVAKVLLARSQWQALPVEQPENCFVVSAAASGHPWLVRSWEHPHLGKPVTRQWERFKRFEHALQERLPALHRRARRLYAIVGPPLAVLIQDRPWAADLVYLGLRPLELVALGLARLLGG